MDFWGLQSRTLICTRRRVILLCWDVIWKMEEQGGSKRNLGFRASGPCTGRPAALPTHQLAITEAAFRIPEKSSITDHSKNPPKLLDAQHGAASKH